MSTDLESDNASNSSSSLMSSLAWALQILPEGIHTKRSTKTNVTH